MTLLQELRKAAPRVVFKTTHPDIHCGAPLDVTFGDYQVVKFEASYHRNWGLFKGKPNRTVKDGYHTALELVRDHPDVFNVDPRQGRLFGVVL